MTVADHWHLSLFRHRTWKEPICIIYTISLKDELKTQFTNTMTLRTNSFLKDLLLGGLLSLLESFSYNGHRPHVRNASWRELHHSLQDTHTPGLKSPSSTTHWVRYGLPTWHSRRRVTVFKTTLNCSATPHFTVAIWHILTSPFMYVTHPLYYAHIILNTLFTYTPVTSTSTT